MTNVGGAVTKAKAWATGHVVAAVAIGVAIGFLIHAALF